MHFCAEPPPSRLLPGLGHMRQGGPFPYFMDVHGKAKQEKCVGLVKGRKGCVIFAWGG